jgi:hypothetical protein
LRRFEAVFTHHSLDEAKRRLVKARTNAIMSLMIPSK